MIQCKSCLHVFHPVSGLTFCPCEKVATDKSGGTVRILYPTGKLEQWVSITNKMESR